MNAKRVKELLAQLGVVVTELTNELGEEVVATTKTAKTTDKTEKTPAPKSAKGDRRAELEALSYNDLKKEAKNCGVKAVGGKEDLINAILGSAGAPAEEPKTGKPAKTGKEKIAKVEEPADDEDDDDDDDTEEVSVEDLLADADDDTIKALAEELGIKSAKKKKVSALKKEILAVEDEEALVEALTAVGLLEGEDADDDDSEDGEDSDEEATVQEQVEELVKDMTDDEVKELLEENGLSVKGKRQAWIARIVEAVEDGTIELGEADDDGDDSEEVDLEEMSDKELVEFAEENEIEPVYTGKGKSKKLDRDATIEAITEAMSEEDGDDDEDDDEESAVDFDEMTDEREEACKKFEADTKKAVKAKKLKMKDVEKFLKSALGDNYDADTEDADKIELYIELNKRMIDDEGEAHDFSEPYTINEVPVCCAQALKQLDNGNLYCEVCGEEFETEE